MVPFGRDIVFVVNCFRWALGNTSSAIDTDFGVNVNHLFVFVKAIDWAHCYASFIFATDTRLSLIHI